MFFKYLLRLSLFAMLLGWGLVTTLMESVTAQQTNDTPAEVKRITVKELKSLLDKNQPVTIIDVRMDYPYEESTTKIKGAIRIAPDEFESRLKEIPRDKEIVTYCT
jgi:predicted sulfurtransferase